MSASDQAYLNTRVTAMSTRLLAPGEIAAMADLTLPELADRLRVDALLDDQLPIRIRSRAVEQALVTTLLADLLVLIRPMNAVESGLLLAWGRKFALFNLKTLIRGKLYDLDQAEIRDNLYDLPEHVRLTGEELIRAENVLELLRALEQGPHSLIARQAREIYEQRREPFALEAAIDQRYYAELVRRLLQFQGGGVLPLQQLLGALLDRVDLLWLLRFRFSYGLSPSEAFYQLVPSLKLLHRDRLLGLANLDSFEEVLEALPPPLDGLLAGCTSLIEAQQRMNRYLSDVARRVLASSGCGVARALAYLLLRETDLFGLFSLVQGQLLGLPRELVDIAIEAQPPTCPTGFAAAA